MKFAKIAAASLAVSFFPIAAMAQTQPSVQAIAAESLEQQIRDDAAAALAALDAGDVQLATTHLRTAETAANRLSLQMLTQNLANVTPSFQSEDSRFALARSSTVLFEDYLNNASTYERRFRDADGNVVTVRVFGEDNALDDFMFIANDAAMIEKGSLELAEMRGETAIKRKGDDGSLSVLMMSEGDHALIEVEGDSDEAVMKFINELETAEM